MKRLGEKRGWDALSLKDVGLVAAIIFAAVGLMGLYDWNHRKSPDPLGLQNFNSDLKPLEVDAMPDGSILIDGQRVIGDELRQRLLSAKDNRRIISVYSSEPKTQEGAHLSELLVELDVGVVQVRFKPKAEQVVPPNGP